MAAISDEVKSSPVWTRPAAERALKPGDKAFLASDCSARPYGGVFEDDGETGYF